MPSDDFNRADGAPGSNWTEHTAGSYLIVSNRLVRQSGGDDRIYWATAMSGTDYYVQARFYGFADNNYSGVFARRVGDNRYVGAWDQSEGGRWQIHKHDPFYNLINSSTEAGSPTGVVVRLEVEGTALRLYVDGVLKASGTDSSLTTGTSVGITSTLYGGTPTIDDFEAGPLGAGPGHYDEENLPVTIAAVVAVDDDYTPGTPAPTTPAYTELEWSLALQAPAVDDEVYEFRVYAGTEPLADYAVTPQLTVTTGAASYNETDRQVTVVATTTLPTDRANRKEPNLQVAVVSGVTTPTDRANRKEPDRTTTAVAIVAVTEQYDYRHLNLPVTVVATVTTPTDKAGRKELDRSVTAVATTTLTEQYDYKQLALPIAAVATTVITDQADFKEVGALVTQQAVRFDSTSDYYDRSGSGLSGPITMALWVYRSVDSNTYESSLTVYDSGSRYFSIGSSASGDQAVVWDGSGSSIAGSGFNLDVGSWYYIAAVYDPVGHPTGPSRMYYAPASDTSLTEEVSTATLSGVTNTAFLLIGMDGLGDFWNGRVAQVKIWNAALTKAELEAEWKRDSVARTSNLWGYYSFRGGPQTTDESGNGRTLDAHGTLVSEAGPPPFTVGSGLTVSIVSTVTSTDTTVVGAINYNETGRLVLVTATTTSTDQVDFKQLALPVLGVATITLPIDRYERYDLALAVAVVATVTVPVDQADFKELARSIAIVGGVTPTDLQTSPGHYDETSRTVSILGTLTLPVDQADYDQLALLTSVVATVTTPVDQTDYDQLALAVAAVTTVTLPTDRYERYDLDRTVTVVSTVTTPTDRAGRRELTLSTAIVSTVTTPTELFKRNELVRSVTVVSTVTTPIERAGRKELTLPIPVIGTVTTPTDQADFEDPNRSIAIVGTVTVEDHIVGAPVNYNETGRLVLVVSTVSLPTDQADYDQLALSVTAVSTVAITTLLKRTEAVLVSVVSTVALPTDQADFKDLVRSVPIISTFTLLETSGAFNETGRLVSVTSAVTITNRAWFKDTALALDIASTVGVLSQADYHQLLAVLIVSTISASDLQRFASGVVLNTALALYLGDLTVQRVYLGSIQVWP